MKESMQLHDTVHTHYDCNVLAFRSSRCSRAPYTIITIIMIFSTTTTTIKRAKSIAKQRTHRDVFEWARIFCGKTKDFYDYDGNDIFQRFHQMWKEKIFFFSLAVTM